MIAIIGVLAGIIVAITGKARSSAQNMACARSDWPFSSMWPDTEGDYSWFRCRHNGHMNVAFADGHVGSFQKGGVLRANVQVNY